MQEGRLQRKTTTARTNDSKQQYSRNFGHFVGVSFWPKHREANWDLKNHVRFDEQFARMTRTRTRSNNDDDDQEQFVTKTKNKNDWSMMSSSSCHRRRRDVVVIVMSPTLQREPNTSHGSTTASTNHQ